MQSSRYWDKEDDFKIKIDLNFHLGGTFTSINSDCGVVNNNKINIAVKKIHLDENLYNENSTGIINKMLENPEKESQSAKKEFEIMKFLTNSNTPNIVKCYGHSFDDKNISYIAMSYAQEDSLYHWLNGNYKYPKLRPNQKIEIMTGVAKAITYMHDYANLTHDNITPSSILLDSSLKPTLCDFRQTVGNYIDSPLSVFESRDHLAPELLIDYFNEKLISDYTKPTDIYSFAITCWQIVSNENKVHPSIKDMVRFIQKIRFKQERKIIDKKTCPGKIAEFITLGWAHSPEQRPTAKQALEMINHAEVPTNTFFSTQQLETAIALLIIKYEFFAAPFTDFDAFQTWAEENQTSLKPLSDEFRICFNSADQIEAFKKALIGSSPTDTNCLRDGNSKRMKDFLLQPAGNSLVTFLLDNEDNPVIEKWFADQHNSYSKLVM